MPVSLGPAIGFRGACLVWLLSLAAAGHVAEQADGARTPVAPPSAPSAPATATAPRGSDAPDPPGTPTRDSAKKAARPEGRSVIRGRVLALDTGTPLRRAHVRILGAEMRSPRAAYTDARGNYEFKDLPAGRYQLQANKGGFVLVAYGQRRPLESGRPLQLADGQTLDKIDFHLPRGGVITGRVVDELGEPVTGTSIKALVFRHLGGQRRLVPAGQGETNDIGQYRVYGLPPGEYYVAAAGLDSSVGTEGMTDNPSASGYAPTYYPGTPSLAEAQRISVTGEDLDGIRIVATNGATVKGRVIYEGGTRPTHPSGIGLHVGCEATGRDGPATMGNASPAKVDDEGRFELTGVHRECLIRPFPTPDDWGLGTVTHNAEDVTDRPLAIKATETIADVTVLLTNRVSRLTGAVTDADDRPVKDYAVIVFPEDPGKLGPHSRFVRSARADQEGQFKMSGLPPGDYLAAALDTLEEGAESDPEFLERIRPSSVTLRLNDGGQQTIGLKIIKPMP